MGPSLILNGKGWGAVIFAPPPPRHICQPWEKVSQQDFGRKGSGGAEPAWAIFKGLWRPGTVLIRELAEYYSP